MDEFRVELRNDPEIYKELYFKEGYRTVSEYIKKSLLATLISGAATAAVLFFALQTMDTLRLVLLGIVALVFALSFLRLMIRIDKYRRWKAPIDAYIQDIARYKSYHIVFSGSAVELQLDGVSHIESIDNIEHSSIDQDYISFGNATSPTKYLIPRKSVRQPEYERIKNYLRETLKHGGATQQ